MKNEVTVEVDGQELVLTRAQVEGALVELNKPATSVFQQGDIVSYRGTTAVVVFDYVADWANKAYGLADPTRIRTTDGATTYTWPIDGVKKVGSLSSVPLTQRPFRPYRG